MSVQAIAAVFDHSESRGSARVVMIVLAEHADPYGFCWPGVKRLAHQCRIDRRNVQRHVLQQVEAGELEVCYREGQSNVYRILLPGLREIDDEQLVKLSEWGVTVSPPLAISPPVASAPPKPSTSKPKGSIREVLRTKYAFCQSCGTELNPSGYCEAGCEVSARG